MKSLNLSAREQWLGNYGYCGETAFVAAGLYYGQYLSQYEARVVASRGLAQNRRESQLLLGVNDRQTAARLRLTCETWEPAEGRTTEQFLVWAARHLEQGSPVIVGVWMNQRLFYGNSNPTAGDSEYDHIVSLVGADAGSLRFSDHGLWSPSGSRPYLFEEPLEAMQGDRVRANRSNRPYGLDQDGNLYAIALTGIADKHRQTVPVRIETDPSSEPPIPDRSAARPPAVPLRLAVTVSQLQPGIRYRLYRYDDWDSVPETDFNANADLAVQSWDLDAARGTSTMVEVQIRSDEIAVFRAVPLTAP